MADKTIVQKEVDVIEKARGFWENYNKPVMYIGSAIIILLVDGLFTNTCLKYPKKKKRMMQFL